MNHSTLRKRIAHPGLWGHEAQLENASQVECEPLVEQLWATLSSMRHQQNQWVTLIGKPSPVFVQQLLAARIQKERIHCILPSSPGAAVRACEQALLLNNSQIVIAWVANCSERDQKRLQLAARSSKSVNFLFTANTQNIPLH